MKSGSISALKYRIIIVAKLAKSESDDSTAAGSTQNLLVIPQIGKAKLCTPGLYHFQCHAWMV